jgi:murein DD-endopeptidase MepM/ murein hydrolase activator NlpD
MRDLTALLSRLPAASVFDFPLASRRCLRLDLTLANPELRGFDPADAAAFGAWVQTRIARAGAGYAAGGYAEDRALYRLSPLFTPQQGEARTLHLGIDLWLDGGSAVHAPLPGIVHSTRDNAAHGDYGPTIVLEHRVADTTFFSLYGHLSRESLALTRRGQRVEAGQPIAWLGGADVNGGWAPHLHFQLIRDMAGRDGDHPGVCAASERATWLACCPDPNLLLRIPELA